MDNDLLTGLLLGACAVGFGAGALWQVLRRKPAAAKRFERRIDRIGSRRSEAPASAEPSETDSAARRPEVGMHRPALLAITGVSGDLTAAEVFVQRAHSLDVDLMRDMEIDPVEIREIQCLFDHACALAWDPAGDLSRDVYEVSFSPVIERALEAGFHPRVNATAEDLQIMGIDEHGMELGDPMAAPDYSWGAPARVHRLWSILNPAEHAHPLSAELKRELAALEAQMPELKRVVSAVDGLRWQETYDKLFELGRDVARLGLEEGRAQLRTERADKLAAQMRAHNADVDRALAELGASVKTLEDARKALVAVEGLLKVRETSILFLRAIALMRVIASDDYIHGMRCSERIAQNVAEFPSVAGILKLARGLALESAAKDARAAGGEPVLAGLVKREADRISALHDKLEQTLRAEVSFLQERIDRCLIVQGHRRRHAVRINPQTNRIEAMLILEA